MTSTILRRAGAFLLVTLATGCGLLDVSDPTKLEDAELDNATSANLLRQDVIRTLAIAVGAAALEGGVLADEFLVDPSPYASTVPSHARLDQRHSEDYEAVMPSSGAYYRWQEARHAALAALPRVRAYTPEPARAAYVGQVLAARGYTVLRLAEDVCPGFPLNDLVDGRVAFGGPVSTTQALELALADFDTAVVYTADTLRLLHLAQVARARTLLALGRFAEAGAAAVDVPSTYVALAEFSTSGPSNPLVFTRSSSNTRYSVANNEGGTGLDYIAAGDPRVQSNILGPAYDGVTPIRAVAKYPNRGASIVLASGTEARLIEAEAALHTGGDWLGILNTLRDRIGLTPLVDPGTADARVDLVFRERAFWLFATGTRLADLRRLVQHYGRDPESVFPTGPYRVGGAYGTATSIPFPAAAESVENPAVAAGRTSR